jgi:hypothetical protein
MTPPKSAASTTRSHLNFDDPEQIARLLLAAVFACIALARGEANDDADKISVMRADALLEALAQSVKP